MTIKEFIEKTYLHDSLITKISHNNSTVKMEIEFCYWLQNGYKEGTKETGMIEITFYNVSYFDSETILGEIDYFSILETKFENDIVKFNILDDFNDNYYTISLKATEVTIREL